MQWASWTCQLSATRCLRARAHLNPFCLGFPHLFRRRMKHNKVHVQKKYDERIVNHIVLWFQCAYELAQPCQSHTISVSSRASRSQFVHIRECNLARWAAVMCVPGAHISARIAPDQRLVRFFMRCFIRISDRSTHNLRPASQRKDKMERRTTAKTATPTRCAVIYSGFSVSVGCVCAMRREYATLRRIFIVCDSFFGFLQSSFSSWI